MGRNLLTEPRVRVLRQTHRVLMLQHRAGLSLAQLRVRRRSRFAIPCESSMPKQLWWQPIVLECRVVSPAGVWPLQRAPHAQRPRSGPVGSLHLPSTLMKFRYRPPRLPEHPPASHPCLQLSHLREAIEAQGALYHDRVVLTVCQCV